MSIVSIAKEVEALGVVAVSWLWHVSRSTHLPLTALSIQNCPASPFRCRYTDLYKQDVKVYNFSHLLFKDAGL